MARTSYPDRTNATGVWKLKDITRNKLTHGNYPNLSIGDKFIMTGGNVGGSETNKIESFNISATGNATDFGDLAVATHNPGTTSNQVRCIMGGGNTPSIVNTMNYVNPHSAGNAADYGDLSVSRRGVGGCSDCVRAVYVAGSTPSEKNTMDYVQFATKGDAVDFGDSNDTGFSAGTSNAHGGL